MENTSKVVKTHHHPGKDNSVKFKKQFSRVSTGATMSSNSHHVSSEYKQNKTSNNNNNDNNSSLYVNKNQSSTEKPAFDRLKSIEKINQERVHLIGLKSQSTSKKNEKLTNDAFDVDLKVNNEFGVPSLDSMDNLRSIGSASMNQGATNMYNLNQSSPLVTNNQYLFIN